jgi:hypothetical protein
MTDDDDEPQEQSCLVSSADGRPCPLWAYWDGRCRYHSMLVPEKERFREMLEASEPPDPAGFSLCDVPTNRAGLDSTLVYRRLVSFVTSGEGFSTYLLRRDGRAIGRLDIPKPRLLAPHTARGVRSR